MTQIVFLNSEAGLRRWLRANPPLARASLIATGCDRSSENIKRRLSAYEPMKLQVVDGSRYIRQFETRFAQLIGALNVKHHGRDWWALNVTNKNPITSHLFYDVYYCLLIREIIEKDRPDCLFVVTSDRDTYEQTRLQYKRSADVDVISHIAPKRLKEALNRFVPAAPFYIACVALMRKLYAKLVMPKFSESGDPQVIVYSLLYEPCFERGSYRDVYFGDFIAHLKNNGIKFINMMEIIAPSLPMIRQAGLVHDGLSIYPKECYVSLMGIVKSLWVGLAHYYKPVKIDSPAEIDGYDVRYLLNRYIRYECISTRLVGNLLTYYAVEGAARRYGIARFYYPFENRSFEKMILLSLGKFSPETRAIGFQHASFSRRHTNFMLTDGEAEITPLPDLIVTLGKVSYDFLLRVGGFPQDRLRVGSALRHAPYRGGLKPRPKRIRNILVALATDVDEYVKTLRFLERGFGSGHEYELWLRPHPVYPLADALDITGPLDLAYRSPEISLEESLQWADVILFVHSLVAIEAMQRGVPVIRLDVDNPVNPDPLPEFREFKWIAEKPDTLGATIAEIEQLSDGEFARRQQRGREFANQYLVPTTEQTLERLAVI